jgi:hypothetical protein
MDAFMHFFFAGKMHSCIQAPVFSGLILRTVALLQIGLECQLSVEDLAFEVQQTFLCYQEPDPNSDFSMCYPSMAI